MTRINVILAFTEHALLRKKERSKTGKCLLDYSPLPSKQADSIVKRECPSLMLKKQRAILYVADTVLPV